MLLKMRHIPILNISEKHECQPLEILNTWKFKLLKICDS